MLEPKRKQYDVIIIGSGIAGLVTGCYLARSGIRVLILERNVKPGGYCGTFKKDNYRFDEAVHYVNNLGQNGILRQVLEELDVYEKLRIIAVEPSDLLRMPRYEIIISRDWKKTTEALSSAFPRDRDGIEKFFSFLSEFKLTTLYEKYSNWSFSQLLASYFKEEGLKTALGVFSTTLGLGPNRLSALAALAYYKGSILDGGYHIVGGAQELSDALARSLTNVGGELICGREVTEIQIRGGAANGVRLEDGLEVRGRVVVSNADVSHTYQSLLNKQAVHPRVRQRIAKLRPSLSMMALYIGTDIPLGQVAPECCNLWYYPWKGFKRDSIDITKDSGLEGYIHIGLSSLHDDSLAPQGGGSLVAFTGASFRDLAYWKANRERLTERLLARVLRVLPKLKGHIKVRLAATPQTMYRYTLNREGAYRGWETTPEQAAWGIVSEKSEVEGLYFVGHWITTPIGNGGVSTVAYQGRQMAKKVGRFLKTAAVTS